MDECDTVSRDPGEVKAELEARRASRLAMVRAVADLLLAHTRRIDEPATNPLLAELGGASLLPYEYTALFTALHGAACASCDEQMEVAMDFAVKLLDRGANVSSPGRHVSIGGAGTAAVKADMETVRETSLHSYPLMWATAAALRTDPGVRVDDALAVVKRMLVAGGIACAFTRITRALFFFFFPMRVKFEAKKRR